VGVTPLESMSGLPPVTVGAGGRRVALTGLRGGAVTMLETTRPGADALRRTSCAAFSLCSASFCGDHAGGGHEFVAG